ncbi:hypothetical protein WJX84_000940 [Apatococcus fuscideae]|uniref:Uncharacterized protein n=1 Tax=Apatococcus fuscideae TaxID=2026836 RepID=A0AAW1T2R4_9CHLO
MNTEHVSSYRVRVGFAAMDSEIFGQCTLEVQLLKRPSGNSRHFLLTLTKETSRREAPSAADGLHVFCRAIKKAMLPTKLPLDLWKLVLSHLAMAAHLPSGPRRRDAAAVHQRDALSRTAGGFWT